ncbi:histidine kinase [Runella rosea]|uniref:histidine kinase n=1 Tax=Runella rosea TaxID=2259595 RepID=A0A344TQR5_9BACT|nr:sensor histidine kinase [Runella rosea]AXE20986.1 histidine kinase [Runella rosea]
MYKVIVLIVAIGVGLKGWAQDYRLEHIGVNQGLSQGSPYHMLKDSRGFMWFGTQDGVNRYDGHSFKVYKPDVKDPHSLHGVNIAGLVEDKQGNVWLGTEEGLNCYERATDRFRLVIDKSQKGIKRRTSPFYVNADELWYIREGDGILAYEFRTGKHRVVAPKVFITQDFDYIDWTTRTPAGDVWMVGTKGIVKYTIKEKKYHYYFSDHAENKLGYPLNIICLYVDSKNIVWLGSLQGIIRLDTACGEFQLFDKTPDNRNLGAVYSIAEGINHKLWIGTQRNGFWNFDTKKRELQAVYLPHVTPRSLDNYEITRIYVDNRGIIWANVDPDGLLKIIPNASIFYKITDAPNLPNSRRLDNFSVRCMIQAPDGNMWIGTEGSIAVLNPKSRIILKRYLTQSNSPSLPSVNFIKSFLRDRQNQMWLGTYGGLMQFDAKTEKFQLYQFDQNPSRNNYTRNILELSDGRLFLGTPLGPWIFDPKTKTFTESPILKNRNVFSVYQAKDSTIWLSAYFEGLYGFKYQNRQWKQVYSGMKQFNINVIREDTVSRTLWIGTEKGLIELNPLDRRYAFYDERHGIANSYIYGVVSDKQRNLWLSTNHGISQLDIQTRQFRNFDLTDGIQGYEYNGNAFAMSKEGEIFFGGVKGFNSFFPERIRKLSFRPSVHLYNFKVNEGVYPLAKQINETDVISLSYDQNTLSMEFAAIDYYSNGQNTYRYKLEGLDKKWIISNNRNYVRYANLAPGKYVFRVSAANRDGVWSDSEKILYIRINPPFWQTWWFYIFCTGLVGYVAFMAGRNRLVSLKQKEQERLKIALEAQEQERKQIAQDLHDEVGARLATLKLYASSLTKYLSDHPESQEIKKKTLEIINDSIVDIRRMLRELSPRMLEQYGYAAAVEALAEKIRQSGEVSVEVDASRLPERFPAEIETGLYRVTQELMNNTLKHAEAKKITIRVHLDDDIIHFDYFDDGKGFTYNQAKQGLGIGNIESRVAVLRGQIVWTPIVGEGNAVFIQIPLYPRFPAFSLPNPQDILDALQKFFRK